MNVALILKRLFHLMHAHGSADDIQENVATLLGLLQLQVGSEHDTAEVLERLCESLLKLPALQEQKCPPALPGGCTPPRT
jgi:hypothetical protein